VLLVDDQDDLRLLLGWVLADAGFLVTDFPGGREALDALRAEPVPDVVVLDVQMPVVDGWETLTAIRAARRTAAVPVILCTVKSGPVDEIRALELGCDGFVTKPFSPEQLRDAVREALARTPEDRASRRRRRLAALRIEAA